MRLLIVEDETALGEFLRSQFKHQGFVVDVAADGEQALYLAQEFSYDAIILDLGLPKTPGLVVLKTLRDKGLTTPILILTARNSWQQRVEGLQLGADDYIGKPFQFEELTARLQACLRRGQSPLLNQLQVAGWCLELDNKTLIDPQGAVHSLTASEFRVLRLLMKQPERVFSKEQILQQIGNQDYESEGNLVEVYIRRLRQIVGKHQIQTQRGLGYRFMPE